MAKKKTTKPKSKKPVKKASSKSKNRSPKKVNLPAERKTIIGRKPFRPDAVGITQKELDQQRVTIPKVTQEKRPYAIGGSTKKVKAPQPLSENECYLLDANSKENTTGFTPSETDLKNIQEGDSVKLGMHFGTGTDFFWATITQVKGNKLKAEVEDKLAYAQHHGAEQGAVLKLNKKNIFKIYKN